MRELTALSIGHSIRPLDEFIALLHLNGVTHVIDVRAAPHSRHNPQFNADTLPDVLMRAGGIRYTHVCGLGGQRRPGPDSLNSGWLSESFQGFADYMQTPEFEQNLDAVIEFMRRDRVVLMCAEILYWSCHRSLIADALTLRRIRVEHILDENRRQVHTLTPWAKVEGLSIIYPAYW